MAKKLKKNEVDELAELSGKYLTILEFMISKYGNMQGFIMTKEIFNRVVNQNNIAGLRHMFNDLIEWAKGMRITEIEELNQLLKQKFNADLKDVSKQTSKRIVKIIQKGKITTEDEFRIMISYVDEIYDDPKRKNELQIINQLLTDFEMNQT